MFRRGVSGLLMMWLLASMAVAASDVVQQEHRRALEAVDVVKRADGMSMSLEVAEPQLATVPVGDGWATVMSIPGADLLEADGMPAVPFTSDQFRLPPTGGAEAVILDAQYQTFTGMEYAAYIGDDNGEAIFGELDPSVDEWYPGTVAEIGTPAIMRQFRVSNLVTYPVQVNAYRQEVRVYSNIDVDIQYTPSGENELDRFPTALSATYLPYYQQMLDWDTDELDDFEIYRGSVQVVARQAALDQFEFWMDWKKQKGYTLDLITDNDVSWNSSSIKSELQSRWNEAEHKYDWVVIIGDDTGAYSTPAFAGYGDQGYVELAGNDRLPEAGIGRISVENQTDLLKYQNKVLLYEQMPHMDDPGWFKRGAVGAGSASSGESTIYQGRYARYAMLDLGYTQVDTAWYNQGVNVNNENRNSIENGVSYFSYRGYINSGLSTTEIANLDNNYMPPMVLHITCGTGNWIGGSTGKNEAWMRSGSLNVPTGGIGAISVATSSTHTRYNNSLAGGALHAHLAMRLPEMGNAIFYSKVNLYNSFYPWASGQVNSFAEWTNLMGDPTVWIWTDTPEMLTVTHPAEIEYGRNGFEVFVNDSMGNPVPNAWVTLFQDTGAEEIQLTAETNGEGRVVLDTPFESGTAKLTVTGQNLHPYQADIDIVQNTLMAVVDYRVVDNGQGGTQGNGNGLAEPGERIGLWVKLHNLYGVTAPNIGAVFNTDDPAIAQTGGIARFGNIPSGAQQWATSLMLMQVSPTAQSGWIADGNIGLGIIPGPGQPPNVVQQDIATFKIHAPEYANVQVTGDENLDPGESAQVSFELANVGLVDGRPGQVRLLTDDEYLNIVSGWIPWNGLDAGETGTVGPFTVAAHPSALRGYPAKVMVQVIATNPLHADTVFTRVHLGEATDTDPVGPDGYGYVAFEDRDTEYDLAPVYDWVEINPLLGTYDYAGTNTGLQDDQEEADDGVVLNMPFPVQFYGETFEQITVSTNGFISMGDQQDMLTPRNWPIPSGLGPNYMIAPYWDDRVVYGANSGVFYYYDEPNGRFIIEWYSVGDVPGGWSNPPPDEYNTFQLILYDQLAEHITDTGDTDILFQYEDVTHTPAASHDNDYMTVGIENGDQTDGLEIAYWHGPSEDEIVNGRAILITTQNRLKTGTVAGTVTYEANGDPVEGALVAVANGSFTATTNANGQYLLEEVVVGQHNLSVSMQGINTETTTIVVGEDSTTLVPVSVTTPGFALSTESITETLPPGGETTVDLVVSNPGNGELTFDVEIDFQGPGGGGEIDEQWDLLADFTLDQAPDNRHRGMAWYAGYLWVAGSNNFGNPNKLYRYNSAGVLQDVYNQPVPNPTNAGFYGMTSDGEFMYGVDGSTLYEMEYNPDTNEISTVNTVNLPNELTMTRYLCYDSVYDVFWIGERYTPIYAINRQGAILLEHDPELSVLATSHYPEDPDGYTLYLYLQETPYVPITVMKMEPQTGATLYVTDLPANVYQIKDALITYQWNPMVWSMFILKDGSAADDIVEAYEVDMNTAWLSLSDESGAVDPGGDFTLSLGMAAISLPEGEYNVWLRFDTNTFQDEVYVPVTLIVDAAGVVTSVDAAAVQPLEWEFKGVYPNPFNPTTTVSFSMKEAADAKIAMYNVLGQRVALLANKRYAAGHHKVVFDGNNLSSGVYFLQFQAGPLQETRKVVLMR